MKYLQFNIAGDHFVVPVASVEEVTPLVKLHEMGKADDAIAGLMDYRGNRVPVVDMSMLIRGELCRRAMNTRIIVVHCHDTLFNGLAGLLAENVMDLVEIDDDQFEDTGVTRKDRPFLGGVATVNGNLTQLLLIEGLKDTELAKSFEYEDSYS